MSAGTAVPAPESGQDPAYLKHKLIVDSEAAFYDDLSTEINDASRKRSLERVLYPPFQRILATQSTAIKQKGYTLSVQGQYHFPVPDDSTIPKFKVNGIEFDLSEEIPDFVRAFVPKSDQQSTEHVVVDIFEIKALDTVEDWNTPEASEMAEAQIKDHLPQVYSQAMSSFHYHPSCRYVYAVLVIGVFFSQFCWERLDNETLSPPIKYNFNAATPSGPLSAEEYEASVAELEAAIEECSKRKIPKILCWHQPVFDFHGEGPCPDSTVSRVTITEEFRWALRQPFCRYPKAKLTSQRTFLSAPGKKPHYLRKNIKKHQAREAVLKTLRAEPLESLQRHYDVLTQSSASTASQRARELQSFGPDLDYIPPGKLDGKVSQAISDMITRARKKGKQLNMEALKAFLDSAVDDDEADEPVNV